MHFIFRDCLTSTLFDRSCTAIVRAMNLRLLREFFSLTLSEAITEPFNVTGKGSSFRDIDPTRSEFIVTRDFPLIPNSEMMQFMGLGPEDVQKGALMGPHEIVIKIDSQHKPSAFSGNYEQPADPPEFSVDDWQVIAVDGVALSPEDATRLRSYIEPLTSQEEEEIEESYYDRIVSY